MLTIIIGSAGSGKSACAERHTVSLPGRKIYLATMLARDAESLARVARHRAQRAGRGFETIERGLALESLPIPGGANILLEDLSNLLANEMYESAGGGADAVHRGLAHLISSCDNLTVVTNEVFSGGADHDSESLRYMRCLADLNRELAARADLVVEVVCGLPNVLKGELK